MKAGTAIRFHQGRGGDLGLIATAMPKAMPPIKAVMLAAPAIAVIRRVQLALITYVRVDFLDAERHRSGSERATYRLLWARVRLAALSQPSPPGLRYRGGGCWRRHRGSEGEPLGLTPPPVSIIAHIDELASQSSLTSRNPAIWASRAGRQESHPSRQGWCTGSPRTLAPVALPVGGSVRGLHAASSAGSI